MDTQQNDISPNDAGLYSLGDMQDLVDEGLDVGSTAPSPRIDMPAVDATRVAPTAYQAQPEASYEMPPASTETSGRRRQQDPKPRKHARHGFLSFFCWLFLIGAAGLIALRMLPLDQSMARAVPELVSFVPWLLAPMGIVVLLSLLLRRRDLAVLSSVALATLLVWHAGFFIPNPSASSVTESSVRVMTLNCKGGKADADEIVSTVASQNVQVLALQEVSWDLLARLEDAGVYAYLPHSVYGEQGSSDNGGINVLFFASEVSNASSNLLPTENSAMAAGSIVVGGSTVRFVSVHPNSPVRGAQGLWSSGLASIGDLSGYDHSYVMMGDFNSTWDHQAFRALLGTTFADAGETAGEGFHMTFPANSKVPPLVEIDHIVYSKGTGVSVNGLQTIEIAGTDHLALLGTVNAN